MLQQATNWGIHNGVLSRSLAIQWFVYQGMVRVQEMEAEYRMALEEERKKERLAELKEEKEGELTEQEKDELKALGHVYDVDEE